MKKLYQVTLTLLLACALNSVYAQTSDYFNYQAVIRTSDGTIMQNQEIQVKFTIENEGGTVFFVEEQDATSDAYGVINISVGKGTVVSGAWNTINWEDELLLLVAIDYNKDGTVDLNGTNMISPVPKANFAKRALVADDLSYPLANVATSGSYTDLNNKPQLTLTGDSLGLEGSNKVLLSTAGKDSLILEGTTLSIAGSNSVELPVGNGNVTINDATTNAKGIVRLAGDLTGTADAPAIKTGAVNNEKVAAGINATKLADGSVSNTELQYIGNLTGDVQAQLNAKVDTIAGKSLSANDYTDADRARVTGAEQLINKNAANGYPGLDANKKIDISQLPAITINNVYTVASDTELATLAPSSNQGDVAINTGTSKNYIHNGGNAGGLSDWTELASPNVEVTSVNGKTGDVILGITDISTLQDVLGEKANTTDLATIATSGSYNDLLDVPANIDTDATNDLLKTDVINNLTTGGIAVVLSAEQGKTLKGLVDANTGAIVLNATKQALADSTTMLRSEINAANNIGTTLQTEIDATQTGAGLGTEGTYSPNGSANYIGSATTLAGADDALDTQVKTNADNIATNTTNITQNTSDITDNATNISDNTAAIVLRATQAALEDTTNAVRSAIDANSANIALNATKVALADSTTMLRSEISAANNIGTTLQTEIDATQAGAGLGTDGSYAANTSTNYMKTSSSLVDATEDLDAQLKINADSIAVNATAVETNTTAIATNASDISDNADAIALRATQAALEDTTTAVRSAIDANSANIALNATKAALADTAGVLRSEINAANTIGTSLQIELDATQTGAGLETDGTYAVNTSANYIGSASTLAGADDALDIQLKINADSIAVNAAAITANTSDISDNTAAIALRATQAALEDTTTAVRSAVDANSATIALNATKVALADTAGVLRSEIDATNTIGTSLQTELDATQSGAGLTIDGDYSQNSSANYISSATTLAGADDALDAQLKINADSIDVNAAAIAGNTTAIASNTSDISDNADAIALRATQAALNDTATTIRGALVDSIAAVRAGTLNADNLTDTYVPYLNGTGLDDSPMKVAAGKVGIATIAAPKEALDINGNINIAKNSSLMIGDSTVLKLGSLGTSTAVGVKASTLGNHTTTVGYHAGYATSKSYGTLVGSEAGVNNTGNELIAMGVRAGAYNAGHRSITIGQQAGDSLKADLAVVIGYMAGQNNAGESSVAIGPEAGKDNIGAKSIAIGPTAGNSNSGSGLIGIGNDAGRDNEGVALLALGSTSGLRNKGRNVTAIGGRTAMDNTGEHVIGIGNGAVMDNQGDYVIALGYEAGRNNTLDNQFIVKQNPVNTTPLIQGDFATGNLNIAGKVTAGENATANMDLVPLAQMNDSLAAASSAITSNLASSFVPYFDGSGLDNSPVTVSGKSVGINTTIPSSDLHIKVGPSGYSFPTNTDGLIIEDTADPQIFINGSFNNTGHIYFGDNSNNKSGKLEYNHFINAMTFSTNGNSERMRIDSTGNVGIGKTSLTAKLDVAGNIKASGKVTAGANAAANMDLVPLKQMNDSLAAKTSAITNNLSSGYLPYTVGSNLENSLLRQYNDQLYYEKDGLARMYIKSYTETVTGAALLYLNRSRGSKSSKSGTQDGDTFGSIIFSGAGSTGGEQIGGTITMTQEGGEVSGSYRPANMSFYTADGPLSSDNRERLTILSTGNIGIGRTAPTEKLDVAGNIKATGKVTAGANASADMDLVPFKQMNDSLAAKTSGITGNLSSSTIPYFDGNDLKDSPVKVGTGNSLFLFNEGEGFNVRTYSNSNKNSLTMYRARGSRSSALASQAGDEIGSISFTGARDGGATCFAGGIKMVQEGAVVGTNAYVPAKMSFYTSEGSTLVGYKERLTIASAGNVGIGKTSPAEMLDVAGNIKASGTLTIAGNLAMGAGNYINADGDTEGLSFDAAGKGTFSTDLTVNGNTYFPSDRRLKTNIETLSDVMDKINRIRGVRFEYKDQTKYATGPKIGVIAQDLQKVYPELVTTGADGYLKVDYTQLTGILLQAVKEQQKEIDTLKQQMETVMKKLGVE